MKIKVYNWKRIEDVPPLLKSWAEYVAEQKLNLEEIKDLIESYENYINARDEIEKHETTIDQ